MLTLRSATLMLSALAMANLVPSTFAGSTDLAALPEGTIVSAGFADSGVSLTSVDTDSSSFIIDQIGADSGMPDVTPGTYLTSGGFSPGAGGTLAAIGGFSADLAEPSSSVSVGYIYYASQPFSVTLSGTGIDGNSSTQAFTIPAGIYQSDTLTLSSATPLTSFTVSVDDSSSEVFTAFGDIKPNAIPEPHLLGLSGLLLLTRRQRSSK